MNNDEEDLRGLQNLWQSSDTPSFDDAEDQAKDEETRQVIAILQQAWKEVDIPAYEPRTSSVLPFQVWRRVASAAAALLLVTLTIWSFSSANRSDSQNRKSRNHEIAEIKSPSPTVHDPQAWTTKILPRGEMVVQKGRVRLILVQPTTMDEPN